MKSSWILPFFSCLLISGIANAQDTKEPQFLLTSGKINNVSGFGGFNLDFSTVNKEFAVCSGGGGGVLINQTFYFGGYGQGLSSDHYIDTAKILDNEKNRINFGHGGLWVGYMHQSYKLVHFNLNSKFGWGSISLYDENFDIDNYEKVDNDFVFVLTPMAEVEFNIARWFKINMGGGYRFVSGIGNDAYGKSSFNSPTFNVSFLFGGFGNNNKKSSTQVGIKTKQ